MRNRFGALLKGLIRCVPCDCGMVHTHATKNGNKRYRYYVCAQAQSRGWHNCPSPSVPAGELERFVVEQVKGLGRDSELLNETLAECRASAGRGDRQTRSRETHPGTRAAPPQRRNCGNWQAVVNGTLRLWPVWPICRTASATPGSGPRRVPEQIAALSRELVDAREVGEACALFDPLWETLTAREQARILHLLIERVDYDGVNGTVAITFHPTGIRTLTDELNREEVAV